MLYLCLQKNEKNTGHIEAKDLTAGDMINVEVLDVSFQERWRVALGRAP